MPRTASHQLTIAVTKNPTLKEFEQLMKVCRKNRVPDDAQVRITPSKDDQSILTLHAYWGTNNED